MSSHDSGNQQKTLKKRKSNLLSKSPSSSPVEKKRIYSFSPQSNEELREAINKYDRLKWDEKKEYWNYWDYGKFNDWDVSKITDMSRLFFNSPFNEPLDEWDVSNVTNMSYMFGECYYFNQPIDTWGPYLSKVTNMSGMFQGCSKFNQPLEKWGPYLGNVTNMSGMFRGSKEFNQPLAKWGPYLGNVTNISDMFHGCYNFNQPLEKWGPYLGNVTDMSTMFRACSTFNQPLEKWGPSLSNVTNMSAMFYGCSTFNQPLEKWGPYLGNVTNMSAMFHGCSTFNQPLKKWGPYLGNVTNMYDMFDECKKFNQPLNSWGPSLGNVTKMNAMFMKCYQFNQPLDSWGPYLSNVTTMSGMFWECHQFNQPLNSWNVSNVTDMSSLFQDCFNFNQPLDNWDVRKVTAGYTSIFINCFRFIQSLSSWKEKNVGFDNPHINKILELYDVMKESQKPSLSLKDLEFSDNIDDYKKIKNELYQVDNPYKIHIETVDNHEFPIITLPKGLMLYTYGTGIDVHNLNRTNTTDSYENDYVNDLKFFYPIPYFALEINITYDKCHVCVLSRDIRLFAAVRPSPINRQDLKELSGINLKVDNKEYQYYPTEYSSNCPGSFDYDPCISNELKTKLNIDGYIGIAVMDSVTHNRNKFQNSSNINFNILKMLFAITGLNSKNKSTYDFVIDERTKLTGINYVFGIPEIVLNLFDNQQFDTYRDKPRPTTQDDIKKLNMNFQQVIECDIMDVQKKISDLGNKIIFTKQAPILFHLHRDYINKDSTYHKKYLVNTIRDFNFPGDMDYNKEDGPSLEMMGYRYEALLDEYSTFNIGQSWRKGGEYHTGQPLDYLHMNNDLSILSKKPYTKPSTKMVLDEKGATDDDISGEKSKGKSNIQLSQTTQGIPVVIIYSNNEIYNSLKTHASTKKFSTKKKRYNGGGDKIKKTRRKQKHIMASSRNK